MLPLRDFNPTRGRATVTAVLIALCAVAFFLVQPTAEAATRLRGTAAALTESRFVLSRAAIPDEVVTGEPLTVREVAQPRVSRGRTVVNPTVLSCDGVRTSADIGVRIDQPCFPAKQVRLAVVTSLFLHAGLAHLAFNMLYLWIFGNNIEDRFGHVQFLLFYLAGGVAATVTHVLLAPSSTTPLVGASGAVAGVMGAYLVLFPNVRILGLVGVFPIPLRAKWFLGFWFLSQFFIGSDTSVAWAAHVGGFVFGVLVGLAVRGRREVPAPV